MKIGVITDRTEKLVAAWIQRTAALPERHSVDAWLNQVYPVDGESTLLEMSRQFTDSGNPEILDIPADAFDWFEIE